MQRELPLPNAKASPLTKWNQPFSAAILNPKALSPLLSPFKLNSCSRFSSPWFSLQGKDNGAHLGFANGSTDFFLPLSCQLFLFLGQIHLSVLSLQRNVPPSPLQEPVPLLWSLISMASLWCPSQRFAPPQKLLLDSSMTGEPSISQSIASPQQSLA